MAKTIFTAEQLQQVYGKPQGVQNQPQPQEKQSTQGDLKGFATGVGKSVLETVQGAGQLGQDLLQQTAGRAVEKITGQPKEQMGSPVLEKGTPQFDKLKGATVAQGGAEKAGKFVGDIAQFVIPATNLSKVQKSASLASKIAGQAISDTTVQSVKEGELNKDVANTAIFSLAFPTALAGGQKFMNSILKKSDMAGKVINSLIKPSKNEFSYGKNAGKAIADEGITANSLDDLGNKVEDVISKRSQEYINEIKKSGVVLDVTKSFSSLDNAIKTAVSQNNQTLVNRLNSLKTALTHNLTSVVDEAGNEIIQSAGLKQLDNLTPEQLVELKRDIGKMTAFTGNPSDDKLVNSALKSIYGDVKSKIDSAVPNSSKMSEKIASLISASTAIKNRIGILERQNLGNFTGKVMGGAGVLTSIFTANPVPALIGFGASGIENAMGTPAFKTRFAKFLSGATKQQKDKLFKAMPTLRAIIEREIGND